jgi:hypothetical protein
MKDRLFQCRLSAHETGSCSTYGSLVHVGETADLGIRTGKEREKGNESKGTMNFDF